MRSRRITMVAAGALTFGALSGAPAWAAGPLQVDTAADSVDADPGDGACADSAGRCSLRAAVQEANASGDSRIDLQRGETYVLTVGGTGEDAAATGDLDVTSGISLDGHGATVDANGIDRVFHLTSGASLRVQDLTITGGVANGTPTPANSGGGVLNAGELVVDRSVIRGNTATRAGGGIEASAGSATTVQRSTLSGNATGPGPGNGGGLHLTGAGEVTLDRDIVIGNSAANEGGGLWNDAGGTMTVTRTTITGNSAPTGNNVFQKAPDGNFGIDGEQVPPGMNDL